MKGRERSGERVYRVIRAYKGPFGVSDIAALAEVGPEVIRHRLKVLEDSGYIQDAGRKGLTRLWVLSQLGRETPRPPRPALERRGELAPEKQALTRLVSIFLRSNDLKNGNTLASIREQLEILNRRFGKQRKEAKNGA